MDGWREGGVDEKKDKRMKNQPSMVSDVSTEMTHRGTLRCVCACDPITT